MEAQRKMISPPTVNKAASGYYIYREYENPYRTDDTIVEYMDLYGKWHCIMSFLDGKTGATYFPDRQTAEAVLKKSTEKNMKKLNGQIQAGNYYKNRRGEKIGPMYIGYDRVWIDGKGSAQDPEWDFNGTHSANIVSMSEEDDLIEEWKDVPKTWDEMSPEEKGALLLATYEGKKIEFYVGGDRWLLRNNEMLWNGTLCYRVAPEPRTIKVIGPNGYKITYKEFDGVPDCSTIKMEKV